MKTMVPDSLRDVLNEKELRWLAGEQAFLHGKKLVARQKVTLTEAGSVWLDATVLDIEAGESVVDIHLRNDGDLGYKCSCPGGQKELFCAHCVAAALLWLSGNFDKTGIRSVSPSPASWHVHEESVNPNHVLSGEISEFRASLATLDKGDLIDFIVSWIEDDVCDEYDQKERLSEIMSMFKRWQN